MEEKEKIRIREKIYSMSNSFLPLDMFYNDIRDIDISNIKQYDKEFAYKDLEKIADFIIDLQEDNKKLKQQLEKTNTRIVEELELSAERRQIIEDLTIENRKLELQLAEKKEQLKIALEDFNETQNENDKLQQQLAEKEHSIGILNQHLTDKAIEIERLGEELKELEHENSRLIQGIFWGNGLQFSHEVKKEKVKFAIAKLKEVKTELVNKVSPVKLSYTDYVQEVFNKLDNQIKQLKGE